MTWFQRGVLVLGTVIACALLFICWCLFLISRPPLAQCERSGDDLAKEACLERVFSSGEPSHKEILAAAQEAKEAAEDAKSAALLH